MLAVLSTIKNKPNEAIENISEAIIVRITHHGTLASELVFIPRNASTITSLPDQIEVRNIIEDAIKNPPNHPAIIDSADQANLNTSTPILEYICWKPSATKNAIARPNNEPINPPKKDTKTPSIMTNEDTSRLFKPNILSRAKSDFRDSASIVVIVTISNIPADMINPPNMRNVPEITPLLAFTSSMVSTLGADTRRFESLIPTKSSYHSSSVSKNDESISPFPESITPPL